MLEWGCPENIKNVTLSGDHFTGTGNRHTRAILIGATPNKIWPWIIQLGQERGGFYSYEWLEDLFLADMHNEYIIRDEFQKAREVGDTIWLATRRNYNAQGYQVIAEIEQNRSFVMVSGDDYQNILNRKTAKGSWAIYLFPEDEHSTWLIARSSDGDVRTWERVLRYVTFEIPHFIMEQKMLRKIKELVEE